MEKKIFTGTELFEAGYDLKKIAQIISENKLDAVCHPEKNKRIFLHSELKQKQLFKATSRIEYNKNISNCVLIFQRVTFDLFDIKCNEMELDIGYKTLSEFEKMKDRQAKRKVTIYAIQNQIIDVQGLKDFAFTHKAIYYHEESDSFFFYINSQSSLFFQARNIDTSTKLPNSEITFKCCPLNRLMNHNSKSLSENDFDDALRKEIILKSDFISTDLEYGYINETIFIEAKHDDFKNIYEDQNHFPLDLIQSSLYFAVEKNISPGQQNQYHKFLFRNAYQYYLDEKLLNFFEDYFIFDFEYYASLYHHFDTVEKQTEYFLTEIAKYRYDMSIIKPVYENTSPDKIITYLVDFYKHFLVNHQHEKIAFSIEIYLLKLQGKSHEEAFRQIYPKRKYDKSYASKEITKVKNFAEKNNLPYINYKALIKTPKSPKLFLSYQQACQKLREEINKCNHTELLDKVSHLNPCAKKDEQF